MARTMIEKIARAHLRDGEARAGEIVLLTPDVVLLNDISGPVAFDQFRQMGAQRVFDARRLVLVADHFSPARDVASAESIRALREFADAFGVEHFYDTGTGGIEHTLLMEIGLVWPGGLVFGADSHTCTAGALNAAGIGFGSSDLAAAMALGELWFRVPDAIRVDLDGRCGRFVTGKDIILELIRQIGTDGAAEAALEFGGDGLSTLNIDERMAVANMAIEAGAETCVMEADEAAVRYAEGRGASFEAVAPDAAAHYAKRLRIELSALGPMVAKPHSPGHGAPLSEVVGTRVHQVYVGNCSNGTLTDLRQVSEILRGRKVAKGVRMIVVPATQEVYRTAIREGLIELFSEAGASVSAPTCGACFGGHMGVLAGGETAIATTNRNFRGRMGAPESRVYLANAWVAAAAAVCGEIRDPAELLGGSSTISGA